MRTWPKFDDNGDLPEGIHQGTLTEVLQHFGTGNAQRLRVGQRLERIYKLASGTGQVVIFVVFGSFVTAKSEPGDVDIFMVTEDSFDSSGVSGEAAVVFDHLAAQNVEGASVFWIRRQAAIGGVQQAVEYWQSKRDKTRRGIVEVTRDD
jgi:hypothetical protein